MSSKLPALPAANHRAEKAQENLVSVAVEAAKSRARPWETTFFYMVPPGLGKTTLATIIPMKWVSPISKARAGHPDQGRSHRYPYQPA